MKTLTPADLPALYPIYFAIFPFRDREAEQGPLDTALAAVLEIDAKPYRTSLDAAYELLDLLTPDEEYVNVDYREYRKGGYVICDINDDTDGTDFSGSNRKGVNRADALFGAIVSAMVSRLEIEQDNDR